MIIVMAGSSTDPSRTLCDSADKAALISAGWQANDASPSPAAIRT